MSKHIVKRAGHTEEFDERKLYASIYAACLAVRVPVGEAEIVADTVAEDVKSYLQNKHEVTSGDIAKTAHQHFNAYNQDAAYIYKHGHALR